MMFGTSLSRSQLHTIHLFLTKNVNRFPVSTSAAFFAEAFGTAVLAFVVFSLTNPKSETQTNNVYIPPLIGLTVGGIISVIAPLTQAGCK